MFDWFFLLLAWLLGNTECVDARVELINDDCACDDVIPFDDVPLSERCGYAC